MSTLLKFELAPNTLQFTAGGGYPGKRKYKVHQIQDRTGGGTLQVETLGVQVRTRVLSFVMMSKTDYDALIDWFLNTVNGGMYTFDFTDEYGDTAEVIITDQELDFDEVSMRRYTGSLTLEYV